MLTYFPVKSAKYAFTRGLQAHKTCVSALLFRAFFHNGNIMTIRFCQTGDYLNRRPLPALAVAAIDQDWVSQAATSGSSRRWA
jgi:hypothetical protein